MILLFRLAARNVLRHRRRTLLTGLSMFGGFVLGAFFIGWADGTYGNIIDLFTRRRLGHIQIHVRGYLDKPSLYATIDDLATVGRILGETPAVTSWTPRLFAGGLAAVGDKSAGVRIVGLDPKGEAASTNYSGKIVRGKSLGAGGAGTAVLGAGLARILSASPGDSVVLLSQAADGSIANDRFAIAGIAESGDEIADRSSLYLGLDEAQTLMALEGRVHEVAVVVRSLKDVDRVAAALGRVLPGDNLDVEPWQVFAADFYRAMKADKEGMYISLVIIILIVAVGVLNTVLMSVLERRREYGVLRALGTRPRRIFVMVMAEVALLALACILVGSLAGYALNSYVSGHGLKLGEAISYGGIRLDRMTTVVNGRSFILPALTVFLTGLAAGFVPAVMAARTLPAKAMRDV